MRRWIVASLVVTEAVVACAIFSCSLQFSQLLVRSRTLGNVTASMVRSGHRLLASTQHLAASTRRIAIDGVRVHITIGDA